MLSNVSEHLNGLRREINGAMNLLAAPLMDECMRLRRDKGYFIRHWSYAPHSRRPYKVTWTIQLANNDETTASSGGFGRRRSERKPQLQIFFVKEGLGEESIPEGLYRFTKGAGVSEAVRPQDVVIVHHWVNTLFDSVKQDFPQVMERLEWALYAAEQLKSADEA